MWPLSLQENDSLNKVRRIRVEVESDTLKFNHKNKKSKSSSSVPNKSGKPDQNDQNTEMALPKGATGDGAGVERVGQPSTPLCDDSTVDISKVSVEVTGS